MVAHVRNDLRVMLFLNASFAITTYWGQVCPPVSVAQPHERMLWWK